MDYWWEGGLYWLLSSDWKVIKYQEYVDAGKPAPYDINELNRKRQAVRDRINEIQKELDKGWFILP